MNHDLLINRSQISKIVQTHWYIKRDLLCKNYFYKGFEHSCVSAVCEYNEASNGKIYIILFLMIRFDKNSLFDFSSLKSIYVLSVTNLITVCV